MSGCAILRSRCRSGPAAPTWPARFVGGLIVGRVGLGCGRGRCGGWRGGPGHFGSALRAIVVLDPKAFAAGWAMSNPPGFAWLSLRHDLTALITGLLVREVWPAGASPE